MTGMTGSRSGDAIGAARGTSAAQRLLDTATELFAAQDIREVGIDRILAEAGVAKASLYNLYGSKDALVLAYLNALDQADRKRYDRAAARLRDPVEQIVLFFDLAAAAARRRRYRGCLYVNAAGAYAGVDLEPVVAHRRWMHETLAGLLEQAGVGEAEQRAGEVQLLYDGALVGSKVERSVAPILRARRLALQLLGH
ncbi:TetR/AcrR family transcriptional regulator [Mycolicibacter hiberniae]|uniref:TetR family transcriptional regulator n=1 Tax=Mycolicibacter hiberniae TaxID=29314 RepID=A0A7I7X5G7_9MYCO|nr:TetR/AcrR family transcriptional regulator [Mycolicibacter hiberniae]ORV68999.1 TetR family transcriptional regulator [Mycolicibacter hiberniae]BBZ25069.1 TetR family transcriptional regulator [Mycolicibacter hiberniae]